MNEQDESEVIMDALAGESTLKKILEMLEDLSRRMANIEAATIYSKQYSTTTNYPPYTNYPQVWYSNTNTTSAVSHDHYTYYNSDGSEVKYYVEEKEA